MAVLSPLVLDAEQGNFQASLFSPWHCSFVCPISMTGCLVKRGQFTGARGGRCQPQQDPAMYGFEARRCERLFSWRRGSPASVSMALRQLVALDLGFLASGKMRCA